MKRRNIPTHKVLKIDESVLAGIDEGLKKRTMEDLVDITKDNFERYKTEINDELKKADRKFILNLFFNDYSWDYNEDYTQQIERPVLFILGKNDQRCGYLDTLDIINYYDNPTLHLLNNAGHNLQIERYDEIVPMIKDWLENN